MKPTRVLLIDRSRLFREGLQRSLPDHLFKVMPAENESVLDLSGNFDLVICSLADEAALSRLDRIRRSAPTARYVVFADGASLALITGALRIGVDAVLSNDISTEVLQAALELVLVGQQLFPTTLVHVLLDGPSPALFPGPSDLAGSDSPPDPPVTFSERESQILRCLIDGHSNKAIARDLHITEATVKVHVKGLLRKLRAANRTQAAIWALNHSYGVDREGNAPVNGIEPGYFRDSLTSRSEWRWRRTTSGPGRDGRAGREQRRADA